MPNLTSIFSSWPSCVEGLNGARVKVNVLILYLASLHSQSRSLPFDGDGGGLRKRNGKTIVWPETQRGSWWESRFLINEGVIIYRRCWLTPFRSRNNVCDKRPILRKEQINERLWILWELALRGNEWCQPRRVWHVETDRRRPQIILSWTQPLLALCFGRIMPVITLHLCPSFKSKHCISYSFFIFYWNKSAICSATLTLVWFFFFFFVHLPFPIGGNQFFKLLQSEVGEQRVHAFISTTIQLEARARQ